MKFGCAQASWNFVDTYNNITISCLLARDLYFKTAWFQKSKWVEKCILWELLGVDVELLQQDVFQKCSKLKPVANFVRLRWMSLRKIVIVANLGKWTSVEHGAGTSNCKYRPVSCGYKSCKYKKI